jgi:predicted nucleic acid-binding Zn ribbon protein
VRHTKMDRGGQPGRADGAWGEQRRIDRAVRLGEALQTVMTEQIRPLQAKFGELADAWSEVVPKELNEHCRIVDATGGELKVCVDSPPYMYELQLCGSELLKELQRQCPQARLKRIKFAVG